MVHQGIRHAGTHLYVLPQRSIGPSPDMNRLSEFASLDPYLISGSSLNYNTSAHEVFADHASRRPQYASHLRLPPDDSQGHYGTAIVKVAVIT